MRFTVEQIILAVSQGVLLGMLTWDLAFDTNSNDDEGIRRARSYYRGLHSAPLLILAVLPVLLLIVGGLLTKFALMSSRSIEWISLLLFLAGLAIELVVAIPAERRLLRDDGISTESKTQLEELAPVIRRIRNAHFSVAMLFGASLVLSCFVQPSLRP